MDIKFKPSYTFTLPPIAGKNHKININTLNSKYRNKTIVPSCKKLKGQEETLPFVSYSLLSKTSTLIESFPVAFTEYTVEFVTTRNSSLARHFGLS